MVSFSLPDHFGAPAGDTAVGSAEAIREVVIEPAKVGMASAAVATLGALRLLTCARSDAQQAFSLILSGDEGLLPRLELTINHALLSRMTTNLEVSIWPLRQLGDYLDAKLEECGIHSDILEPQARTLLLQASKGTPRMLNAVLQEAMEHAAGEQRRKVSLADMQAGVNAVPWAALAQR